MLDWRNFDFDMDSGVADKYFVVDNRIAAEGIRNILAERGKSYWVSDLA